MAQRRMFSKKITDTDIFLDMPATTQNLYFHLNMHADDDGFLGNAKTIKRMVGANDDDLRMLEAKQFILTFPDGVTVIRDWRVHNYIQKDRYRSTIYTEHKRELEINENQQYQRIEPTDTECIQDVSTLDTQVRLGKVRLELGKDRDRLELSNKSDKSDPLPYKDIIDYLNSKTGKKYRHSSKKTRELIRARANDGFNLDDFKRVIDNKVSSWGKDKKMVNYLRPETLFGTKFESYLNERGAQRYDYERYTNGIEF